MVSKRFSRRDWFQLGGAGILASAGGMLPDVVLGAPKKIPVGLQLYSVRQECAKDLAGTIEKVAKMGYQGVEFAGYFDHTAKDIKKMLDNNGIRCCGTHTGLDTLLGDKLEATVAYNQEIGNKYLVVPSLPKERLNSLQACLETAKIFNSISEKIKASGMLVGYHNHTAEFQPVENGEKPWDILFKNTQNVIMQFDTGNALHGGAVAVDYLNRYPKRATTIHLKEFSQSNARAIVGEGDVPWKEIFAVVSKQNATDWYIVEWEHNDPPPIQGVAKCLENLRKMGL